MTPDFFAPTLHIALTKGCENHIEADLTCLDCYPPTALEVRCLREVLASARETVADRDCGCGNVDALRLINVIASMDLRMERYG